MSTYLDKVNEVAQLMIDEWNRVETHSLNISYYATFADMARVIVKNYGLDEPEPAVVD